MGGQKKSGGGGPKKNFSGALRRKWAPHFQFASYAPATVMLPQLLATFLAPTSQVIHHTSHEKLTTMTTLLVLLLPLMSTRYLTSTVTVTVNSHQFKLTFTNLPVTFAFVSSPATANIITNIIACYVSSRFFISSSPN